MVFRRDSKTDSFQRQMSAIRQQIGGPEEYEERPARQDSRHPADENEELEGAYGFSNFASSVTPQAPVAGDVTPVAPVLPTLPAVDAQTTVIAHDTTWKGEIQSQGTVHVHGRFEGTLTVRDDVYVAEEAEVDATIAATNVIIAGNAKGTLRCNARFEVLPSGRVSGDIQAPTLVVHEGATVSGQLRMGAPAANEAKPAPVVQRRVTRGTA